MTAVVVHRWIVTYDIRSDRVRNRVADVLEGWGVRVQFSVFECRLGERDLEALKVRLKKVLGSKEAGSIRMYRLCRNCEAKSVAFGDVEPPDEAAAWVR